MPRCLVPATELQLAQVGVTPDGLARAARARTACRLLENTDLSVLQVASASGFGSVRQLNRVCREIFRASPTELRARRGRGGQLHDRGLFLRLPFDGPLDWAAQLQFLAAHAVPGVERVAGETYRRTILVRGERGVLELARGSARHLHVRLLLPHWGELSHIVQAARRMANLDLDLGEPTRGLVRDPVLARLVAARPGVRPPGAWDPFEAGVRAIIGQRYGRRQANLVAGRIVQHFGDASQAPHALGLTHLALPSPRP